MQHGLAAEWIAPRLRTTCFLLVALLLVTDITVNDGATLSNIFTRNERFSLKPTNRNKTATNALSMRDQNNASSYLQNNATVEHIHDQACFHADTARTEALLALNVSLPKPIINVGMPKCGSSTLESFFYCVGMKTSHDRNARNGSIGLCMRKAIESGKPPIQSCDSWYRPMKGHCKPNASDDTGVEALLQIDEEINPLQCVFPQISYLEEIHKEAPNATFILNSRPVLDWASSAIRWRGLQNAPSLNNRLSSCHLLGLNGNTTDDLSTWLCGHVQHIHKFVADHPSHALIG